MAFALFNLLLLLPNPALADSIPAECQNVAAYEQFVTTKYSGTTGGYLKNCSDTVGSVRATIGKVKAAKQNSAPSTSVPNSSGQSGAFSNAAATAGGGATAAQGMSESMSTAHNELSAESDFLGKQIKRIDSDRLKILGSNQNINQDIPFANSNSAAKNDLVKLQNSVNSAAAQTQVSASDYQGKAAHLRDFAGTAQQNSQNTGNNWGAAQPVANTQGQGSGVSSGEWVALGGAGLIAAGAIGGMYYVSQKDISTANSDATARINQGQVVANGLIANAGATATAVLTAAQNAATQILQFAFTGANQVITNEQTAAQNIFNDAQAAFTTLSANLQAEIQSTFQNLTATGLQQLNTQLQSMFAGLIAQATAAGNTLLAQNLQNLLNTLQQEIQNEINLKNSGGSGTNTSTSVATSTSTSTGSSTATTTSTVTSNTVTNTVTNSATNSTTATMSSTSTSINIINLNKKPTSLKLR
jgi:hypothetical protein